MAQVLEQAQEGICRYTQEGMVKGRSRPLLPLESEGLEVVKGSGVRADSPAYPQGEPGCRLVPWARHPRPRAFASLSCQVLESMEPILPQVSCLPDTVRSSPNPTCPVLPPFPVSSCFLTNSLNACLAWHLFLLQFRNCLQSCL